MSANPERKTSAKRPIRINEELSETIRFVSRESEQLDYWEGE
jgi:hypothetical protein